MTDALVEAVARDMLLWQHGNCVPWDGWHICVRDEFRDRATAALQAIEAAGYRVVPVEATEGMRDYGIWVLPPDTERTLVDEVWSAMLSAAPRVGEGV